MENKNLTSFELPGKDQNLSIQGDIYFPGQSGETKTACVVFSPDFLLPRKWGFYPFLGEKVSQEYAFITYDPSFSGFKDGGNLVHEPELMARYTLGSDIDDFKRLLKGIRDREIPGSENIDPDKIFVSGHGKGAAIALLSAVADPSVKGTICLSAISTLMRFSPKDRDEMKEKGFIQVEAPISGQTLKLSRTFLDELENNKEEFSLQKAVKSLDIPIVFIHGEEDLEVSVKESESLYHWSKKENTRLVLMEKTGHTFGADHPFKHPNKELNIIVEIYINFIKEVLAKL